MISIRTGGGHDYQFGNLVQRDFNLKPTNPHLDAEPNYEDHLLTHANLNPEMDIIEITNVRKQTYRSVFAELVV